MREIPDDRFDARKRTEPVDTPSLVVVPSAQPGKLWVLPIAMVLYLLALAAIVEGNAVWFLRGMATLFGLMAIQLLAADCREVRLEIDARRVVVRYRNTLFARFDVAFPMDRFGSVRTWLTRNNKGYVHFYLELVTRDGKGAVVLTFGYANPRAQDVSGADLEPEPIAEVRRTIARRLGIRDEGCVGFAAAVPNLSRQDGERA